MCVWWEAPTRRLADGTTTIDAVGHAKAATREFYHGGIAEPSIYQSGGRSTSSGPGCSFIGLSIGSVAQKLRTMGRGNVTARSCGSSGVTIAWCPDYEAVGNRLGVSGAAKRLREPGGSMRLTASRHGGRRIGRGGAAIGAGQTRAEKHECIGWRRIGRGGVACGAGHTRAEKHTCLGPRMASRISVFRRKIIFLR
jgi:hypothetical protein